MAATMSQGEQLDGNAAAGLLGGVFAFDVTVARVECAGCHHEDAIACLHVYALEMGAILRCPACNDVMLRVSNAGGTWWLDTRGMERLQISGG
jgi:hypothetical protein